MRLIDDTKPALIAYFNALSSTADNNDNGIRERASSGAVPAEILGGTAEGISAYVGRVRRESDELVAHGPTTMGDMDLEYPYALALSYATFHDPSQFDRVLKIIKTHLSVGGYSRLGDKLKDVFARSSDVSSTNPSSASALFADWLVALGSLRGDELTTDRNHFIVLWQSLALPSECHTLLERERKSSLGDANLVPSTLADCRDILTTHLRPNTISMVSAALAVLFLDHFPDDLPDFSAPMGGAGAGELVLPSVAINLPHFYGDVNNRLQLAAWLFQLSVLPHFQYHAGLIACAIASTGECDKTANCLRVLEQADASVTDRFNALIAWRKTASNHTLRRFTIRVNAGNLHNFPPTKISNKVLVAFRDYLAIINERIKNTKTVLVSAGLVGPIPGGAPIVDHVSVSYLAQTNYLRFSAVAYLAACWCTQILLNRHSVLYRRLVLAKEMMEFLTGGEGNSAGKTALKKQFSDCMLHCRSLMVQYRDQVPTPQNEQDCAPRAIAKIISAMAALWNDLSIKDEEKNRLKAMIDVLIVRCGLAPEAALDTSPGASLSALNDFIAALKATITAQYSDNDPPTGTVGDRVWSILEGARSSVLEMLYFPVILSRKDAPIGDPAESPAGGGAPDSKPSDEEGALDLSMPIDPTRYVTNVYINPDPKSHPGELEGFLATIGNEYDMFHIRDELICTVLMSISEHYGENTDRWSSELVRLTLKFMNSWGQLTTEDTPNPLYELSGTDSITPAIAKRWFAINTFTELLADFKIFNPAIYKIFAVRFNKINIMSDPERLLRPIRHLLDALGKKSGRSLDIGQLTLQHGDVYYHQLPVWPVATGGEKKLFVEIFIYMLHRLCFLVAKIDRLNPLQPSFNRPAVYGAIEDIFNWIWSRSEDYNESAHLLINFFTEHFYMGCADSNPGTFEGCLARVRKIAYEEQLMMSRCDWSGISQTGRVTERQEYFLFREKLLLQLMLLGRYANFVKLHSALDAQITFLFNTTFDSLNPDHFKQVVNAILNAVYANTAIGSSARMLLDAIPAGLTVGGVIDHLIKTEASLGEKFSQLWTRIRQFNVDNMDFWLNYGPMGREFKVALRLASYYANQFEPDFIVAFTAEQRTLLKEESCHIAAGPVKEGLYQHDIHYHSMLSLETFSYHDQCNVLHINTYVDTVIFPDALASEFFIRRSHVLWALNDSVVCWGKKYQVNPETVTANEKPVVVAARICIARLSNPGCSIVDARKALKQCLKCVTTPMNTDALRMHEGDDNITLDSIKGRLRRRLVNRVSVMTSPIQDVASVVFPDDKDAKFFVLIRAVEKRLQIFFPREKILPLLLWLARSRGSVNARVVTKRFKVYPGDDCSTAKTFYTAHVTRMMAQRKLYAMDLPVMDAPYKPAITFYVGINALPSLSADAIQPLLKLLLQKDSIFFNLDKEHKPATATAATATSAPAGGAGSGAASTTESLPSVTPERIDLATVLIESLDKPAMRTVIAAAISNVFKDKLWLFDVDRAANAKEQIDLLYAQESLDPTQEAWRGVFDLYSYLFSDNEKLILDLGLSYTPGMTGAVELT